MKQIMHYSPATYRKWTKEELILYIMKLIERNDELLSQMHKMKISENNRKQWEKKKSTIDQKLRIEERIWTICAKKEPPISGIYDVTLVQKDDKGKTYRQTSEMLYSDGKWIHNIPHARVIAWCPKERPYQGR